MKFIRIKQVAEMTTLSIPSIYRLASEGKFPKQIKLAENSSRWLESEVMDYINKKIEARDK
jgi:prophage regulatory protein